MDKIEYCEEKGFTYYQEPFQLAWQEKGREFSYPVCYITTNSVFMCAECATACLIEESESIWPVEQLVVTDYQDCDICGLDIFTGEEND